MNITQYYDNCQSSTEVGRTASAGARLLATLRQWTERADARRRLREMDDRLLQDIGIRRGDALLEAAKPFWQP